MTENTNWPPEATPTEAPLESWKEIATYLKRGVRTVKRWEKHEALPVRRHLHQARSSVYAYPSELEAWKTARQPEAEKAPWRRPVPALAFALVLLLALLSVASGPILNPPGAAAQESGGMVARQVWAGPDVDISGALSPDGGFLAYTDWSTGDLAVQDLATGEKRRLTNKGSWFESSEYALFSALSSDSQQVAYGWLNKDEFFDLRVIGIDGSEPRVLYRDEELDYVVPVGWSPDGKQILALFTRPDRSAQIVLVSAADGSVRVLRSFDWRYQPALGASLSPDGRYVAYSFPQREDSPEHDIVLLAVDGSSEIRLVEHPANDLVLGWAPEGKHVLFASDRTGTMDAWVIQVADGKPQGSPELIKRDLGQVHPLGFTRKGSFYYGLFTEMSDVYLAALDPATGTVLAPPEKATQRFIGANTTPDWSPDGQYLAYISVRGSSPGHGEVITIRSVETGEKRDLPPRFAHTGSLRWSPDGRSILLGGGEKGHTGLYQTDVQTGDVTVILRSDPGADLRQAVWSPDGKAIFYRSDDASSKSSRILVRDLETGREKELYRSGFPSSQIGTLALSPDGRQVAFFMGEQATGASILKVMPAAGGEPREVLRLQKPDFVFSHHGSGLAWTPDGRYVLFGKAHDGDQELTIELWRISAEGGEPQRLGLAMAALRDLRFHPDGRQIAFTAGQPKAEVWVLENFLPKPEAQTAQVKE